MPELPEVQTVVDQLGKKTTGFTIRDFWSDWPKRVQPAPATVKKTIVGAKILGTRRFGKTIVIDLSNGYSLIIHLKMTGHLLVKNAENDKAKAFTEDPKNGFIHHIFTLDRGTRIEFSDMRKFAWIELSKTQEVASHAHIEKLGVDALSKDFTLERFRDILKQAKKRPIAILLLDQKKISGVGNIYRSEALFRSGILPTRRAGSLTRAEQKLLHQKIQEVLREAVKLRGTSDGDFRDTSGLPGRFQETLYVYRREGLPCKRCGTIVKRKKLGQRSVFFCPKCQK